MSSNFKDSTQKVSSSVGVCCTLWAVCFILYLFVFVFIVFVLYLFFVAGQIITQVDYIRTVSLASSGAPQSICHL